MYKYSRFGSGETSPSGFLKEKGDKVGKFLNRQHNSFKITFENGEYKE